MVAFAAILVFTLALIIFSFPVGLYTVFDTRLSTNYTAATQFTGIYVFLGPALVVAPIASNLGILFIALTAIYAGMFALAATQGRSLLSALKEAYNRGLAGFFSNNLWVVLIAIGFLDFTIVEFDNVESTAGIPVGGLSGDAFQLFMSVVIAPLREEIGFRVLIIGLFALVACVGMPWRKALKALWRPSVAYEGRTNTSATTFFIGVGLALSSLAFGVVHVTSNSGWEIGKLPEAAFAGVILGYVYIKYGIHVAVLVHWGDDYLGSVYGFYGQGAFGIPWTSNNPYLWESVTIFDLFYLIGLGSFLLVVYLGLQKLLRDRAAKRLQPSLISEQAPAEPR